MTKNKSLVPIYSSLEKRLASAVTSSLSVFIIPYSSFLEIKNKELKWYKMLYNFFHVSFLPFLIITGSFDIILLLMIAMAFFGFIFPAEPVKSLPNSNE